MIDSTFYDYIERIKKLSPTTLDLVSAKTEEEFDVAFDSWLEQAIYKLETNKLNFNSLDENGLSAVLAAALSTGEISVTQEQNSNGHVDLTIKLNNSCPQRIKLGEAKIWRGPSYHVDGMDQLINRYTTARECRGFVISYVKLGDIKSLFEKLRKYIDDNKPFDLVALCEDHNIRWSFVSKHKHSSGELVSICHIGCNMYL